MKSNLDTKQFLFTIFLGLVMSTAVFAQDYYVANDGDDGQQGTLGKPWKTLAKANSSLRAGDTLYIRQGTYPEMIEPQHSGTAGAKIRYQNYQNEVVKVVGRSAADYVVKIREAYIVVQGLTLYHADLPGCSGYDDCWNSQSRFTKSCT